MENSYCLTRGVNDKVADDINFSKFVLKSLNRHFNNDFSECDPEDAKSNNEALKNGDRIFSVYNFNENIKIFIITGAEPHRDRTTVLFPNEY